LIVRRVKQRRGRFYFALCNGKIKGERFPGRRSVRKRKRRRRRGTYIRPPLEQHNLLSGPLAEAKGGDGLGRLVVVGGEQVIEALVADGTHEPFAGEEKSSISHSFPFLFCV
jgi:hypothetical protein